MTASLCALLLLAAPPDYTLLHIVRNSAKVTSYSGTLVQAGLVEGAEVKATVALAAPNLFSAKITEPAVWAGIAITYDGHTLQSYYPQLRWAIRLRNLELPSGKDVEKLIEYQYQLNQRTYDFHIDGTTQVAGLSTLTLWHAARAKDTLDARGWTKVYDPYSFALAGEFHFPRSTYAFHWDKIAFNQPVDAQGFSVAVPEGTLITDWDLGGASVDVAAMRKEASFPIVLPDDNKFELRRTQIVRAAGPVPAFCVRYQRGPHFLILTANAAAGVSVPGYGIPLELGAPGRLILGPTSSYAFVREGTYYTLLGNLPTEELLKVAAQINAAKAP